jgi:arginase
MTAPAIDIIGAQIGEGASDPGCKLGPSALRRRGLAQLLDRSGRPARWSAMLTADPQPHEERLATVGRFAQALARQVAASLERRRFPLVLGGDHSAAIGTWSAVAEHLRPRGDLGLVWIDAHLDAHTPETSETGAPHGMPLAALLGHGPEGLCHVGGPLPKIKPHNLCLIGARSFESGEHALLQRLGVRLFPMEEVTRRGLRACLDEALARVAQGSVAHGVSFDLDALDPRDAPGTGCRVADGIRLAEAVDALHRLAGDPRLAALELVEYDPHHDVGGITAGAAESLLLSALAPQARLPLAA